MFASGVAAEDEVLAGSPPWFAAINATTIELGPIVKGYQAADVTEASDCPGDYEPQYSEARAPRSIAATTPRQCPTIAVSNSACTPGGRS